jgi:hypothetical protein
MRSFALTAPTLNPSVCFLRTSTRGFCKQRIANIPTYSACIDKAVLPPSGRPVRRPRQKRAASGLAKSAYSLAPPRGVFFLEFAPALQARLRAERAVRRATGGARAKSARGDFAAGGQYLGGVDADQIGTDDWHPGGGDDDDDFPANDGGDDYEPVDAIEVGRPGF